MGDTRLILRKEVSVRELEEVRNCIFDIFVTANMTGIDNELLAKEMKKLHKLLTDAMYEKVSIEEEVRK